jgi:hypothetical protein
MKRLLTAGWFVVALFGVAPAGAELTADEKASALRLRDAMVEMTLTVEQQIHPLTSKYTGTATKTGLGLGTTRLLDALDATLEGVGALYGIVPTATPRNPETWLSPRSARIAYVYGRIDHALGRLAWAKQTWQELKNQPPPFHFPTSTVAEYQGWINSVIARTDIATGHLNAFRRDLTYGNPYPADFPTIIGPHGQYDLVQWQLWRAAHYFRRAANSVATAIYHGLSVNVDSNYKDFGRPYISYMTAVRGVIDALFVVGRTPYSADLQAADPFFALIIALGRITLPSSLPGAMHFVFFDLNATWLKEFALDEPESPFETSIKDALVIANDAWKHSDNAVWGMMTFPECSRMRDPARTTECQNRQSQIGHDGLDWTGNGADEVLGIVYP